VTADMSIVTSSGHIATYCCICVGIVQPDKQREQWWAQQWWWWHKQRQSSSHSHVQRSV